MKLKLSDETGYKICFAVLYNLIDIKLVHSQWLYLLMLTTSAPEIYKISTQNS